MILLPHSCGHCCGNPLFPFFHRVNRASGKTITLFLVMKYSLSHLRWHFQHLFQSSKLKARMSLSTKIEAKETRRLGRSSFHLWVSKQLLKIVTAGGIGCSNKSNINQSFMNTNRLRLSLWSLRHQTLLDHCPSSSLRTHKWRRENICVGWHASLDYHVSTRKTLYFWTSGTLE